MGIRVIRDKPREFQPQRRQFLAKLRLIGGGLRRRNGYWWRRCLGRRGGHFRRLIERGAAQLLKFRLAERFKPFVGRILLLSSLGRGRSQLRHRTVTER